MTRGLDNSIVTDIVICLETYGKPNGLHAEDLKNRIISGRQESGRKLFSLSTYYKQLDLLKQKGIVERISKGRRDVTYKLNKVKLNEIRSVFQEVDGGTLETLASLINTLNCYWEQPFFGLIGTEPKEQIRKLIYIRNTCRKIANRLDMMQLSEAVDE